MPFIAGDFCCSHSACVLLDVNASYSASTWDLIPHVTQISTTETANTPKLVTSSTNGREVGACGTVASVGTLAIACHSGSSQPGILCINRLYRIRWSEECDNIWDDVAGSAIANNLAGLHFEATIRITSVPIDFNIKGNSILEFSYGFDVVEWITQPPCQAQELTA